MKKNKMMRIASVLLIAVLLTTSIISGTFAKYVTSDNAADSARVAKFGVVVTATGSLFDWTYKKANDNGPGGHTPDEDPYTALTVESDTNVVAPGTKNNKGLSFAVTGTPEVDVKVDFSLTGVKEVYLKANDDERATWPDMTKGAKDATFELDEDYYPVKFTLTQTTTGESGATTTLVNEGKLADVKAKLAELTKTAYYDANTNLSEVVGTFTLKWEWAFDGNDQADTLLGYLAAEGRLVGITKDYYNLETAVALTVTVTQVD